MLFVIFKAVLVGVLFGGLVFAIVSAKGNSREIDAPQEEIDSQEKTAHRKSQNKFISSVKMIVKFIFTCFVVMGILIIPFVLLKIIM